jgi:hypothetical protein
MMKGYHRAFRLLASLAILLSLSFRPGAERLYAYVLPPQQLLQFMVPHFSKFHTLVVKHSVERETQEGVKSFEEILKMKSPDLLHSETTDPVATQGRVVDRSYRRLFFARSWSELSAFLSEAGVDMEKASFTRVDGTVAYLIGEQGPERPRLALEQARFLPLLFVYPSRLAGSPDLVKVLFRDYRQVDPGWYPFEILCTSENGWTERYRIESIQVNVPMQPSLFLQAQEELRPEESPARNEKIDGIIKTFERKYGQ